jgi:hypothetical protein
MVRRSLIRLSVILAALGLVFSSITVSGQDRMHRGRKYKAPPPTSRIEVTILRSDDSKPITNAAVVFHLIGDKGNMELKTNDDGKAVIDVLPTNSKVLLQVIARGYQTYGGDYAIDKPSMEITVKMNRPGKQYSIYNRNNQSTNAGKSSNKDGTPDAGKDASPKSSDQGKSADSGKQQEESKSDPAK